MVDLSWVSCHLGPPNTIWRRTQRKLQWDVLLGRRGQTDRGQTKLRKVGREKKNMHAPTFTGHIKIKSDSYSIFSIYSYKLFPKLPASAFEIGSVFISIITYTVWGRHTIRYYWIKLIYLYDCKKEAGLLCVYLFVCSLIVMTGIKLGLLVLWAHWSTEVQSRS